METIAARGLNVDVSRYERERPQEYRRANYQARDRVELRRCLMGFSPMSHGCLALTFENIGANAGGFMTGLCPNENGLGTGRAEPF
jgi:hypothetical protein